MNIPGCLWPGRNQGEGFAHRYLPFVHYTLADAVFHPLAVIGDHAARVLADHVAPHPALSCACRGSTLHPVHDGLLVRMRFWRCILLEIRVS